MKLNLNGHTVNFTLGWLGAVIASCSLLLLSGSAWGLVYPGIRPLFMFLCVFGVSLYSARGVTFRWLTFSMSTCAIVGFYCLVWNTGHLSYLHHGAIVLIASLVCFNRKSSELVRHLVGTYELLLGLGFIAYACQLILGLSLGILVTKSGVEYSNSIFALQLTHAPHRFNGIFWEPGLLCTNTLIIYFLALFSGSEIPTRRFIVFMMAFILSNSFAGLAFALGLCALRLNVVKSSWVLVVGIAGLVFLRVRLAGIIDNFDFLGDASLKMQGQSLSGLTRLNCLRFDWQIYRSRPLLGVGFQEYFALYNNKVLGNQELNAQTSTFTQHLAIYGAPALVEIFGVAWGGLKRRKVLKGVWQIFVLISLVVMGCKEPNTFNALFNLMLLSWIFGKA